MNEQDRFHASSRLRSSDFCTLLYLHIHMNPCLIVYLPILGFCPPARDPVRISFSLFFFLSIHFVRF